MGAHRPGTSWRWLLGLAAIAAAGCEPTNEGYQPTQPIAFSHAVHAGANKIPCLYCHFGAETSRHAGIPPAQVCMNCHGVIRADSPEIAKIKNALETQTPIEWIRVHRVPDHAFFSHEPHVTVGVGCDRCHGAVETMAVVQQFAPLTMGFCIDCHRTAPLEFGDKVAAAAMSQAELNSNRLTDCSNCHH